MIFRQELVDQILAGRKTMTRRPVKHRITSTEDGDELLAIVPRLYEPGRTYAVQPGRGKKAATRIQITGVRRERWIDITEADAILEGFGPPDHSTTRWSARDEFLRYVHGLYPDLDVEAECWVIEFKLVEAGE